MAEELKQFTIDLQGETVYTGLDARYGDTNTFKVTVEDNGEAADLTGATAMVSITRLDGDVKTVVGTIEGNVVTFKLMGDSLKIAGLVRGAIIFYYADSRTSTADFTFTASYDPTREGFKPDELDESLIQTVLKDGPKAIADAQTATQEANDATFTLTGAVGGAISSLNQDKEEALQEMDDKKAELDQFILDKDGELDLAESGRSQAFSDAQQSRADDYAGFKANVEDELQQTIDGMKYEYQGTLENDAELSSITGMQEGDVYRIVSSAAYQNRSRTVRYDGTAWVTTDLQDPTAINTISAQLDETEQDLNARVDNLIIGSGNANAEVIDAHLSATKNLTFSTLKARFESLENDTFKGMKNIIANGNFVGTTGWSILGGALATENNEGTFTMDGTQALPYIYAGSRIAGNVYYSRIYITALDTIPQLRLSVAAVTAQDIFNPVVGQEYVLSDIRTSTSTSANASLQVRAIFPSAPESNGKRFKVRKAISINLSDTFTPDNMPTKPELEEMLSYYPDYWFDDTVNLISNKRIYEDLKMLEDRFGTVVTPEDVTNQINQYMNELMTEENESWVI